MSANVHVHLHVADLARSRDFYERFLGVAPVKLEADYANQDKFWVRDPDGVEWSVGGCS